MWTARPSAVSGGQLPVKGSADTLLDISSEIFCELTTCEGIAWREGLSYYWYGS